MGLELFAFIKDLVSSNPTGTDPKSEGDDHLRGIKETLLNQFPGFTEGIGITRKESDINNLAMLSDLPTPVQLGAPIGSVVIWPTSANYPAGYLPCKGQTLQVATYPALAAILGSLYGGDGVTSFKLPDLRGYFVRGWNDDGTVDPGRTIGSTQADDFKAHTHGMSENAGTGSYGKHWNVGNQLGSATTYSTGGTETRPKNIALVYLMRAE